jgi:hypothetical protein
MQLLESFPDKKEKKGKEDEDDEDEDDEEEEKKKKKGKKTCLILMNLYLKQRKYSLKKKKSRLSRQLAFSYLFRCSNRRWNRR